MHWKNDLLVFKEKVFILWISFGGGISLLNGRLRPMSSYRTWSTSSGFYSHPSYDNCRFFFIFSRAMCVVLSCDIVSTSPWLPTRMVRITFSGRPPSYCTRSVEFRPYLGRELFRIAPSDAQVPFFSHRVSSVQFSKQKNPELSRAFSPVGFFFFVFTVFSAMRCWGEPGWIERTCGRTDRQTVTQLLCTYRRYE